MSFAYIAINVRNFNHTADFRENATSLNIEHGFIYYYYDHSGYKLKIQIS